MTKNTQPKLITATVSSSKFENPIKVTNHQIIQMMEIGVNRPNMADFIGISQESLRKLIERFGLKRIKANFSKSFKVEVDPSDLPTFEEIVPKKTRPAKRTRIHEVAIAPEPENVEIEEPTPVKTNTLTKGQSEQINVILEQDALDAHNSMRELINTANAALKVLKGIANLQAINEN